MGSGSFRLAQITGPAKDNGKGGSRLHPELFQAPRSKSFSITRTAPGIARSRKPERAPAPMRRVFVQHHGRAADMDHESNQANRAISTSQLNASPRLHTWPINVVVFHGSDREHSFQGGFPA